MKRVEKGIGFLEKGGKFDMWWYGADVGGFWWGMRRIRVWRRGWVWGWIWILMM